jgi:molybdate transport system ATP-binding protein
MSLAVDIEHRQGDFVLRAAFRAEGRLTALFGRSGSGKTTLVNAIAGLVRPNRGHIAAQGQVLVDTTAGVFIPTHRRRIGYVFQEGRLFPHLTVRQNLTFGCWFSGRNGRGAPDDLEAVVALLGIEPLLARRPERLSGGEKQRVAIGRALLARPRLLLMDEPLASLDEARKAEILPYVEALRDQAGVPIVYVSHAVAEVARLADTVVALDQGRITAAGPVSQVLGGPSGSGPLMRERDGGAVLEGRVAAHDDRFHLTRVATPAGEILVPRLDRPVEATLRVLVSARDVMLAIVRPEGVSALNVLPGVVVEVGTTAGAWRDVRLLCGEAHLVARITARSAQDLALAPGCPVFAVIKGVTFDADRIGPTAGP